MSVHGIYRDLLARFERALRDEMRVRALLAQKELDHAALAKQLAASRADHLTAVNLVQRSGEDERAARAGRDAAHTYIDVALRALRPETLRLRGIKAPSGSEVQALRALEAVERELSGAIPF